MYVSMKGMLKRANEGNYAVMAINCLSGDQCSTVIKSTDHHQYRTGTYGKSL